MQGRSGMNLLRRLGRALDITVPEAIAKAGPPASEATAATHSGGATEHPSYNTLNADAFLPEFPSSVLSGSVASGLSTPIWWVTAGLLTNR